MGIRLQAGWLGYLISGFVGACVLIIVTRLISALMAGLIRRRCSFSSPTEWNALADIRIAMRCPTRRTIGALAIKLMYGEVPMKRLALLLFLTILGTTILGTGSAFAQSCDNKAVSKAVSPFMAQASFLKKCKTDACATKAVSANGKPLAGAAKASFLKKCRG